MLLNQSISAMEHPQFIKHFINKFSGSSQARFVNKHLQPAQCPLEQRLRPICAEADVSRLTNKHASTGSWRKDHQQSDPMEPACDAVELNWVLRKAIGIIKVMEVEDTEGYFKTVLKAGGVLDVVEKYPWDGSKVVHSRRDKRFGKHTGIVRRTERGPEIFVEWDDPYGGTCSDVFEVSPDGRMLTVHTDMYITKKELRCQYKSVYKRER